jgi:hypothetical protein
VASGHGSEVASNVDSGVEAGSNVDSGVEAGSNADSGVEAGSSVGIVTSREVSDFAEQDDTGSFRSSIDCSSSQFNQRVCGGPCVFTIVLQSQTNLYSDKRDGRVM